MEVKPPAGAMPVGSVGAMEAALFLTELLLLPVLAVAGARMAGGLVAVTLALILPLSAAIVWGLYLAPRASKRVPYGARLAGKLALFLGASALLAASGAAVWGLAFLLIGGGLLGVGEVRQHRRETARSTTS